MERAGVSDVQKLDAQNLIPKAVIDIDDIINHLITAVNCIFSSKRGNVPAATSTRANSPTRVSPLTVHFWVSQFG